MLDRYFSVSWATTPTIGAYSLRIQPHPKASLSTPCARALPTRGTSGVTACEIQNPPKSVAE